MTIGKKLFCGFGAMIGLTGILGVIALVKLATITEGLDGIANRSLPNVYLVGKISEFAKDQKASMLSHLASGNAMQRTSFERAVDTHTKKLMEGMSAYQKNNTSARDREFIRRLSAADEGILRAWAKVKGMKSQQAMNVWIRDGIPAAEARAKVLQEMSDASRASGDADSQLVMNAVSAGRLWLFTVLMLAVASGCGIAFFIMRSTNSGLRKALEELGQGADEVTGAAAQISSGSQSLAQGTSQQAASLEETSASTQEMAAMAKKNADSSLEAAELMSIVDQRVLSANETLSEMVVSMHEITSSSDKISKIIKVIDEIAFQTNILALNAAVEAARAGEAGMGFAVVAEEVRNLAQRSAQAAKDTAALIEESIGRSNEGRTKLSEVEEAIRSITESSQKVKSLVDGVNLSSSEQARGAEQIANAITQMEQVTQQAAASAEESAAAGEEMTAQAKAMLSVIARLRAMVEGAALAQKAPAPELTARKAVPKTAYKQKPARAVKKLVPAPVAVSIERDSFPMDDDFKEF